MGKIPAFGRAIDPDPAWRLVERDISPVVRGSMIIAIDGPAASGKGTIGAGLAEHYGLPHLDTGLLYRAVGLEVIKVLDLPGFTWAAIKAAKELDPTQLDKEALGGPEVALAASRVSRIEEVREALRQFQRDFASQPGGAVLDGRDIGTRICPDADVKLFITANPEVRARRRAEQLRAQGKDVSDEQMLDQIIARDEADRDNPAGAFYVAKDAHLLDTSEMDIEAALRAALAITEAVMADETEGS